MRRLFFGATLSAALGAAGAAQATPVLIDDFIAQQQTFSSPILPTFPSSSELPFFGIGGFRAMQAETLPPSSPTPAGVQLSTNPNGFERLVFNTGSGILGRGTVTWDGLGSAGLGGIDLTGGGMNSLILFDVLAADLGVTLNFTARDVANNSATETFVFAAPVVSASPVALSFSSFAGVDFGNIDFLQLVITGPTAADVTIGRIAAIGTVPLPASLPLLLAGLGGLAFLRQRSRTA